MQKVTTSSRYLKTFLGSKSYSNLHAIHRLSRSQSLTNHRPYSKSRHSAKSFPPLWKSLVSRSPYHRSSSSQSSSGKRLSQSGSSTSKDVTSLEEQHRSRLFEFRKSLHENVGNNCQDDGRPSSLGQPLKVSNVRGVSRLFSTYFPSCTAPEPLPPELMGRPSDALGMTRENSGELGRTREN